jgi:hypothetical protein
MDQYIVHNDSCKLFHGKYFYCQFKTKTYLDNMRLLNRMIQQGKRMSPQLKPSEEYLVELHQMDNLCNLKKYLQSNFDT